MTPDLSYATGIEGESSARTINGMGKKLIQHENSFQTSYTNKKLQQGTLRVFRLRSHDEFLPYASSMQENPRKYY